jgi:flagellar FliJ protein
MKKFKFSLEKVLIHRQINVDLAQKDFSDAVTERNLEQKKLNDMIDLKNKSLDERTQMVQQTVNWTLAVEQINSFILGQDLRIKNQTLRLKKFENIVESKREILRQSVSEVKILEKLKEKQQQAYLVEVAKAEQDELDELSVLRFSRIDNLIKGSHEDGI